MKRKEPYVNMSWPIYILFVVVGCTLAKVLFDGLDINSIYNLKLNIYVWDALLLIYGFVSCVLVYQLGKLIFGKIAGFNVLYFNLCLVGWRRIEGKMVPYFGGKEGFTIKVDLIPNENKKQNYALAYWGGTILTLIVVALTYGLIFALKADQLTRCFFIVSSIFYAFSLLGYMLPVRMDNINDGFTLILLRKYKLQDTLARNKRNELALYDSTKELEFFDYGENNDPFSMEGKIYNYFYAIKKGDRELLKEVANDLANNHKFLVSDTFANIPTICQIYMLCVSNSTKEISDLYWKLDSATRKAVRNPKDLSSYKVGLYIAGKVDDSKQSFYEIYDNLEKAKANYPYPSVVDAEVAFVETLANEIIEECKNWENPVEDIDYTQSSFTQKEDTTPSIENDSVVTIASLDEEEKEEK